MADRRRLSLFSLGEAIRWSGIDRSILTSVFVIFLASFYLGYFVYFLTNPETAPYLDPSFARRVFVPTLVLFIGVFVAVVLAGLILRRRRSESAVLVHAAVQLYAVGATLLSYYLGYETTPFWVSVFVGGVAFGALLYDNEAVFLALASALALIVVTIVGAQMGLLPYGPAFLESPATGGRLAASWLLGCGGIIWFQVSFIAVQIDVGARRLGSNKDALVETSEALSRTAAALRASNQELDRAYRDLRHAQDQLVQSEKMASLGQLVAGIGHDLANPASFLQGGLANLRESLDGLCEVVRIGSSYESTDAETRRAVAEMRERLKIDYRMRETSALLEICAEGSNRIRRIVDDLRVFARADRGERVPVDVSDCVGRALDRARARLEQGSVTVVRHDEALPPVLADPGQLQQVWRHLLDNAIDALAGRPGPTLSISTRTARSDDGVSPPRAYVEVEIADNGRGIDEESRARIFDPFFTTKPVGEGTGLGLSIAFGAIQNHGGTIAVDSRPGHGTRVVVRLPAAD